MLVLDLLGWWYARGWRWVAIHLFVTRNTHIASFFSITALLKTLFAPFRQDYIETKGAPVGVKLQALGGNIISRFLGMLIRLTLIFCGLLLISANTIVAAITVVVWPLVPLSPVLGIVLAVTGVGTSNV